jgi:hypothetical protein
MLSMAIRVAYGLNGSAGGRRPSPWHGGNAQARPADTDRPGRVLELPSAARPFPWEAMPMTDLIDAIQWPAMLVTVGASWLVGSTHQRRRSAGFWLFVASNVLWAIWGLHIGAPALIVLQFALAGMNVRGMLKARAAPPPDDGRH